MSTLQPYRRCSSITKPSLFFDSCTVVRRSQQQVRSQNDLISGMEGQMFDARGLLGGTLRRINTMMAQGGSRHMCYLVAFIVFTFMAIWYILKQSRSGR